ncbi:MAG TPA: AraC family transcriptional regulator [Candidatus Acidoferrales bacterium]|nr:AraC family transcriptional regulator [Candidatus Acidoferrales bacterium]
MNNTRQHRVARYHSAAELLYADSCAPLEAAALKGQVRLKALARGSYPGRRLPGNDLREICSVGYWDARGKQNWGLDWHCNEGIEFTFLAAGRLPFAVDNCAVNLQAGDLTITRPWQKHRVGDPNVSASRLIWLILDVGVRRPNQPWRWPKWLLLPPGKLQRLTHQLRHNEQIAWRANRGTARCFAALGAGVENRPNAGNLTRLKIHINELFLALADLLDERRPRLNVKLSSAERTVKLFLADLPRRAEEPWTLETMAGQCGLGRSHFGHYCRKLTNRTPIDYLTVCRVEKACELLRRDQSRSITDVAFDSGFQSSQYFATIFSLQKGMSPTEWRRKWSPRLKLKSLESTANLCL